MLYDSRALYHVYHYVIGALVLFTKKKINFVRGMLLSYKPKERKKKKLQHWATTGQPKIENLSPTGNSLFLSLLTTTTSTTTKTIQNTKGRINSHLSFKPLEKLLSLLQLNISFHQLKGQGWILISLLVFLFTTKKNFIIHFILFYCIPGYLF